MYWIEIEQLARKEYQLPQMQSIGLPGAFLVGFTLILTRINTNAICGYRRVEVILLLDDHAKLFELNHS